MLVDWTLHQPLVYSIDSCWTYWLCSVRQVVETVTVPCREAYVWHDVIVSHCFFSRAALYACTLQIIVSLS